MCIKCLILALATLKPQAGITAGAPNVQPQVRLAFYRTIKVQSLCTMMTLIGQVILIKHDQRHSEFFFSMTSVFFFFPHQTRI